MIASRKNLISNNSVQCIGASQSSSSASFSLLSVCLSGDILQNCHQILPISSHFPVLRLDWVGGVMAEQFQFNCVLVSAPCNVNVNNYKVCSHCLPYRSGLPVTVSYSPTIFLDTRQCHITEPDYRWITSL